MQKLCFILILSALTMVLLTLNSFAVFDVVQETTITGTLENAEIAGENTYWLKLDEPIVSARGSKSERTVSVVTLLVPADMLEKVSKLGDKHVAISGTMECRPLYTPWSAECDMQVKEITRQERK
jgi:hypothetical protein